MTARERWLAVLRREKPDRVPLDYWSTPEATRLLMEHLGCPDTGELYRRLHIDRPLAVGPRYVGPAPEKGTDIYGCGYQIVDYGTGTYAECVHNPLAQYDSVEEIEASYRWPDPDWYDFSAIAEQVAGNDDRPIQGGYSEPFLLYKNLRGQELAFMDLLLEPEIVHYCLDKLFDLAFENTRRIYEEIPGQVMLTYVAEDMGGQEGLMLSPVQIREFLFPGMKRMIDLAHDEGAYVLHHNDGAIREILPEVIDLGIDILNPIQWRCSGMAREDLKRDFGDQVVFHAGVDNQYTLAFGSVDEVRLEVADNLRILGAGGGYIPGPCHNVQAISPPENIVAMYEMAYELGWVE
jgi:uroporphyrinogen decarboxylase